MFLFKSSSRLLEDELPEMNEAESATADSWLRRSFSTLKRCLREPLLHFLVIGLVLFGFYAYINRGRSGTASPRQIVLSLDELATMEVVLRITMASSANSTGISGHGRRQNQGRGAVS